MEAQWKIARKEEDERRKKNQTCWVELMTPTRAVHNYCSGNCILQSDVVKFNWPVHKWTSIKSPLGSDYSDLTISQQGSHGDSKSEGVFFPVSIVLPSCRCVVAFLCFAGKCVVVFFWLQYLLTACWQLQILAAKNVPNDNLMTTTLDWYQHWGTFATTFAVVTSFKRCYLLGLSPVVPLNSFNMQCMF